MLGYKKARLFLIALDEERFPDCADALNRTINIPFAPVPPASFPLHGSQLLTMLIAVNNVR